MSTTSDLPVLEQLFGGSSSILSGEIFHSGTLGEGMRAAISEVEHGYREMIEGWKRQ